MTTKTRTPRTITAQVTLDATDDEALNVAQLMSVSFRLLRVKHAATCDLLLSAPKLPQLARLEKDQRRYVIIVAASGQADGWDASDHLRDVVGQAGAMFEIEACYLASPSAPVAVAG